jgi:hypothetical protein
VLLKERIAFIKILFITFLLVTAPENAFAQTAHSRNGITSLSPSGWLQMKSLEKFNNSELPKAKK